LNLTWNLKHKTILTLIYSAGLRVSEAAKLKVNHIDTERMQIYIKDGKGGVDRYALL
jgi:site-specific recombinase XerD